MGTCPIKKIEKKMIIQRVHQTNRLENNLAAIIVDSLGWPDQQNGRMTSSCSAFDSTHFKRIAAWKTVDIVSPFIIINMGADQRILLMKIKQSGLTTVNAAATKIETQTAVASTMSAVPVPNWRYPNECSVNVTISLLKEEEKENSLLTKF